MPLVGTAAAAALLVGLLIAGPAAARESAAALSGNLEAIRPQLEASPLGVPVVVASSEDGERVRGVVHALLGLPFERLAARLATAREWCQVALLHLNVKSCTHERNGDQDWLTFHSGRKGDETPGTVAPLRFEFTVPEAAAGRLAIELVSATGPFGTSDYRIALAAVPAPQGTFLRLSYAYRSTALSRLAVSSYLATIGRDKVGFTVVGTGPDGKPEYVRGRRGIVERNAVRYYFAIQAFLETAAAPAAQRFERSLERWFDLTERFPTQLRELERSDYLRGKLREFQEQSRRQRALDARPAAGAPAPAPEPAQ